MIDSNVVSQISKEGNYIMGGLNIISLFNEIYDSTNKCVLAFITNRCANISDAGDIFQDTYMELYQLIEKRGVNYVTDGKALVFKIAKRKIARNYSLIKRLRNFVPLTVENESSGETEISDYDYDYESAAFLTEDFIVNQIMLDNAKRLIKQKPADIEQIFYFFYDMELSISEIAEILSISESNVKNKLYRTLKELKNLLN